MNPSPVLLPFSEVPISFVVVIIGIQDGEAENFQKL